MQAILKRASTDMTFRAGLLTDPRAAITKAFGMTIPPDFRIKFVERGPDLDALVVLPDVKSKDEELSEDDLEHVAGGTGEDLPWAPGE
jgi:hypothetical protein